jgi:phosphoribosylformylglycinamidine cyclo-ligase
MNTKPITYAGSGVGYEVLDMVKRLAQIEAKKTLRKTGIQEQTLSRGESAYVWQENDCYRAFVIEGLGTKNLIADEVRKLTGKTYYDALARDTVAMIINDLIVVGAKPQVINAYFAVGKSNWFSDSQRTADLIKGWGAACRECGAVWGGGETPTLKDIISGNSIDLAGSATGIIKPKNRLTLGDKLISGDAIIFVASNGIHANGLTLARSVARRASKGYASPLPDGSTFGEALLRPTPIYAKFIEVLFDHNVNIHYMVNITGHGWRKLMRANRDFTYIINTVPTPQPEFKFIQSVSKLSTKQMYETFNMGAGFALFVPLADVRIIQKCAIRRGLKILHAGSVSTGPKCVRIKPLGITLSGNSLRVRGK